MNAFQDWVFWCVVHKDQIVFEAGLTATFGILLTALVAAFYSAEAKEPHRLTQGDTSHVDSHYCPPNRCKH